MQCAGSCGENQKLVDAKLVQFCRHAIKQVLLRGISIETGPKAWNSVKRREHCRILSMTSADIRDVLSISSAAPSQKQKKTRTNVDPAIKNATGITRELYSLLGEGTPPIAFIKQDRFKDKPKLNKKATPW